MMFLCVQAVLLQGCPRSSYAVQGTLCYFGTSPSLQLITLPPHVTDDLYR